MFKSLVGMLGVYLGFNIAYLFLIETGILDNIYLEEQIIINLEKDQLPLHLMTLKGMSKAFLKIKIPDNRIDLPKHITNSIREFNWLVT